MVVQAKAIASAIAAVKAKMAVLAKAIALAMALAKGKPTERIAVCRAMLLLE